MQEYQLAPMSREIIKTPVAFGDTEGGEIGDE